MQPNPAVCSYVCVFAACICVFMHVAMCACSYVATYYTIIDSRVEVLLSMILSLEKYFKINPSKVSSVTVSCACKCILIEYCMHHDHAAACKNVCCKRNMLVFMIRLLECMFLVT